MCPLWFLMTSTLFTLSSKEITVMKVSDGQPVVFRVATFSGGREGRLLSEDKGLRGGEPSNNIKQINKNFSIARHVPTAKTYFTFLTLAIIMNTLRESQLLLKCTLYSLFP